MVVLVVFGMTVHLPTSVFSIAFFPAVMSPVLLLLLLVKLLAVVVVVVEVGGLLALLDLAPRLLLRVPSEGGLIPLDGGGAGGGGGG